MNSKERFLNACKMKPVDRPPVWLMRQAGRYLPEYRLMRARHDFIELCKTPELAVEVTLQPWLRYKMDALIIFSDILFVPEAMGQKLTFKKDEGPKLSPIIKTPKDLSILKDVNSKEAFSFVYDEIRLLKEKLTEKLPIIGFAGAPWTLGFYMTGEKIDDWRQKNPEELKSLLQKITNVVSDHLENQINAGADAVQIFDTWAGELTKEDFMEFVLPNLKEIVSKVKGKAPIIIYVRKCSHILHELLETGADVISIDPLTDINEAAKVFAGKAAIQGNIDPKILLTTAGAVKEETSRLLSRIKGQNGYIINLGHGVLPTTPLESVEAMVETVKHS